MHTLDEVELRRQALQIVAMLPPGPDDARKVLMYCTMIVDKFWAPTSNQEARCSLLEYPSSNSRAS